MSAEQFIHFEKSEPHLREVESPPETLTPREILMRGFSVVFEIAKVVFQGMDYTSHEQANRKS